MDKKIIYATMINQFRHGTIKEWETKNPILLEGEIGVVIGLNEIGDNLEDKTQKAKIGDGIHPWNELEWWSLIQSDGPDNDILVDQTYNPESENAQSGKAVAEALQSKMDKFGEVTADENGNATITNDDDINLKSNNYLVFEGKNSLILKTGLMSISANNIDFLNAHLCNLAEPENASDAVTKNYVDTKIGNIDVALDELHLYAQSLVNGGATE